MSFRLRIVWMTTMLMTLLFCIGGTALIYSSFQTALKKEEQSIVEMNEMILRMVQYVEKDEKWITEKDLVEIVENLSKQDRIDALQLFHGENVIFVQQKGELYLKHENQSADRENGQMVLSYFNSNDGMQCLQSSMIFLLNQQEYCLDIGRKLTDVYETREAQIGLFQKLFLLLSLLGIIVSWVAATFLTGHLRKLTKAVKEITDGNLSYRTNILSNDEVGALAEAFDTMAEALEEYITALKETAEQKERFMGAFTHELKTPMTSIIGYADLMRTQKLNKKDETDALNYIFSEGKRLENLSLKMLDLFVADKKEIVLKCCSPSQITEYTVQHLRNVFMEERVDIKLQAEEGCCMLDPDLFQTLLINLLDNAKKAMEQGGTIVVHVDTTEDGCILCVKDEGKGIPKEAVKHLTEAFYRVDKARARKSGSAGLGLSLCEKIVELHHGTMIFDSEEGAGTKVTVFLNGGR